MLILWQDPVAAEAHAEAAASVAEVSADHEAAEALGAALLAVLTVAVLEVHTMAVHSADIIAVVLADIITLPHPHIITDRIFTARSGPGVALI